MDEEEEEEEETGSCDVTHATNLTELVSHLDDRTNDVIGTVAKPGESKHSEV